MNVRNMLDESRASRRAALVVIYLLALVLMISFALWWVTMGRNGTRITAYFDKTVGVYSGSEVKVLGIGVGKIDSVTPQGDRVRVEMTVEDGIEIPANVEAVVVAPSLVSDRYVQLTPAYESGPLMKSGTVIPLDRTATPVELDDLTASVNDLATALGPNGANKNGAVSNVLDTVGLAGRPVHDRRQPVDVHHGPGRERRAGPIVQRQARGRERLPLRRS
jgi:phospholipid/cholesterol/gamma-HCH transport system substrate-binding protein